MSARTMEVLPLPRCCPILRGLRLGTSIPNKCTLQAPSGVTSDGGRTPAAAKASKALPRNSVRSR
jgi:hypothetical protein